ncbi:MAG: hypothetical protein V3U92_19495 [Cellulophaga sp.]
MSRIIKRKIEWEVALRNKDRPDEIDEVLTGLRKQEAVKEFETNKDALELRKITWIQREDMNFGEDEFTRYEDVIKERD